ncbi:hypothetical protein TRIP_E370044 [uncultured Spirochaetota bacterium]|nr:hypothetical protein TRIP_E370044 [uncultured Spirochaetota bacterium]
MSGDLDRAGGRAAGLPQREQPDKSPGVASQFRKFRIGLLDRASGPELETSRSRVLPGGHSRCDKYSSDSRHRFALHIPQRHCFAFARQESREGVGAELDKKKLLKPGFYPFSEAYGMIKAVYPREECNGQKSGRPRRRFCTGKTRSLSFKRPGVGQG